MVKYNALAPACLFLWACGGTTGSPPDQPDAGPRPDAAEVSGCVNLESSYGDLGAFTGEAVLAPTNPDIPDGRQYLSLAMPVNEDAPPDVFFLELWGDSPPFEDGFAPVTLTLNGDQSDLILCAACAFLAPDHEGGDAFIDYHLAYSGELILTAVDATPDTGMVQGTLSNIKMHQVELNQNNEQETVEGGCLTEIEALSFDFTVVAAPAE